MVWCSLSSIVCVCVKSVMTGTLSLLSALVVNWNLRVKTHHSFEAFLSDFPCLVSRRMNQYFEKLYYKALISRVTHGKYMYRIFRWYPVVETEPENKSQSRSLMKSCQLSKSEAVVRQWYFYILSYTFNFERTLYWVKYTNVKWHFYDAVIKRDGKFKMFCVSHTFPL